MNSLNHPHFAEPAWLWLAFLGPLALLALQLYSASARRRQLNTLASPEFVEELTASHSRLRRLAKNGFLLLAVVGIGVAMARPQWGERQDASHLLGEDLLFVLDCSRSMLATDVAPSRLQRAKLAILEFVQRHGRGRVGLVAFSGQAFLQCPLTFDYAAFQEALMYVDDRTIPVAGTDVGRGLDEAFRAMDKQDRLKFMILVTDGEDLEKTGVRIAQDLAQKGVVIFTIGVGTKAGSEIQVMNEQGRMEVLRDSNGQTVLSQLDEPVLEEIAKATKAQYYPLGPLGEGLAKVRLALETSQVAPHRSSGRKLGVDRFHVPVACVLALLVAESLLGTRRRRERAVAE